MHMRQGVTLIEVVIAILVFSIGGLGLAASAASIVRQLSANSLRVEAGLIARSRAESAHSSGCADLSGGETRSAGIRSVWSVAGSLPATLDLRIERSDHLGLHTDRFLVGIACD